MAAPSDLTILADCKAWLGLTSTGDDAVLASLITAISAAVLADLGRTVLPRVVTDTRDGGGTSLPLGQWPVSSVLAVSVDGVALAASPVPGAGGWVLDPADAVPPGTMQRLRIVGGRFPRGQGNVSVTYRAGYEMLGEAALVPSSAPYVVTAQAPFGAWCLAASCAASAVIPDGAKRRSGTGAPGGLPVNARHTGSGFGCAAPE